MFKTIKKIKKFLNLINFYRRFIRNFFKFTKSLAQLI